MSKRFQFLLASAISMTFGLSAERILPQAALDRALEEEVEMSARRQTKASPVGITYDLAYSSPVGAYYVFNRSTGGYIIVSGDDRIYPLLADVGSGTFSKEEIAPGAECLIDAYEQEIQSFSDSDFPEPGIMDYYNQWLETGVLVKSHWDQSYPYNIYCPAINSRSCMTGCVATAMAQVVCCVGHYEGSGYRSYNGVNSSGQPVEFDYGANSFDFDLMLEEPPSDYSAQTDQIGRLMLACGLSAGMSYGVNESGAYSENVPAALTDYFGYDKKYTRIYRREFYSQVQWERMIYGQLQLGRPVYYSGSGNGGSHAYVIDGYRPVGLYHVNWGWSGLSDGYFRLSALNPSQVGTGGSLGGFSLSQRMVTAVPPGADPGVVFNDELGGSIRMVSDGVYAVYYKGNGYSLLNVAIGAAIVDRDENIVASATFWDGYNFTGSVAVRHDSYRFDFSRIPLAPGDYRIYPAYRTDGSEQYCLTAKCSGFQHYMNLTVSEAGEYIMTNTSTPEGVSDISISGMVPDCDQYVGHSGVISFYAVNNGNEDYAGTIGLTMSDSEGCEVASLRSFSSFVGSGANTVINAEFPVFDASGSLIPAGSYSLRFTDSEGNLLSDGEYGIDVKAGSPFTSWTPSGSIGVLNGATIPAVLISGDLWDHTPLIKTTQTQSNMTLELAFFPRSSATAVKRLTCFQGTLYPMESTFPISPMAVDVPFGSYDACYCKGYNQISLKRPLRVGVRKDGVCYLPASDGGASAFMMPSDGSPDAVVVPETVTVDGTQLPVTAVEPEGFMLNSSLSVIDLPSGVKTIGANAFSVCRSLEQIIMRSEEPPFVFRNHIAPGLNRSVAFYVPASAYDSYRSLLENYNQVYSLVETIESGSEIMDGPESEITLSYSPAHESVDPAFVITPADDMSAAVAEAGIVSVGAGKLRVALRALSEGVATFHITPAHRSDSHSVLTVTVTGTASVDGPARDNFRLWPADVFTVTGLLLKRNAGEADLKSLSSGVYLLRSPAGIRKVIR